MALTNTPLGTSISTIYTSSGNSVISVIYFCNFDSSARTLNLYAVQAAGTAGGTNQIYKDVQIASGDTFVVDMEKLVLANSETIQANISSGTSVVATVSYVGI
jgi:hypothetical protein